MEPGFYKHWDKYMVSLPPQIPVNEAPMPPAEEPTQEKRPETIWTSWSPNVFRGSLDTELGRILNDGREHEGWRAQPSQNQENPTYMTSTNQQPFFFSGGDALKDDDEGTTPRASDHSSKYPYPDLSLPHPTLSLDFRMSVTLDPRISVGATPFGHRNWISFTGGTWSGSWGSGICLPGGQDSQLIIGDGSARLETNYILQTYDNPPAYIVIKTHGWRTGPPEILAKLADPEQADGVDPNSYKFRLFIDMETGDERYKDKVNCGMWVGSGMRKGAEVIYDAYRVN